MKFKIVFYLFLFVCIILFFQLINTNKILNHQDRLIQNQNSLQIRLKDSLASLKQTLAVQNFFSFKESDKIALEIDAIKSQLLSYNTKGDLNLLINSLPQNERFLVDNIQFVNGEWILIGFRGDKHWGQAFLTYKKVVKGFEFKVVNTVINNL